MRKAIMKASQIKWIIIVSILLALTVLLDLYVRFGEIFNLSDVHHETLIMVFSAIALTAFIILKVRRR
jgi:hypothetical protein